MDKNKKNLGIQMVWITVSNFEKAVSFYRDVLKMTVHSLSEEWKWAELEGAHGSRLGICEPCDKSPHAAGDNAVICFTVENLDEWVSDPKNLPGAEAKGPIQEVPGHVKMQLFADADGNLFHIVQTLDAHKKACC